MELRNLSMMRRATVVGIGEILWDVFPDGPRFGGAPANFACSVAELARDRIDVYAAGAVGTDGLGRTAIEVLRGRGVDTVASQLLIAPPDKCSSNSMLQAERVTSLPPTRRGIISHG